MAEIAAGVFKVLDLAKTGYTIYSAIETAKKWAELNRKLDEIQATLTRMETRLTAVYGETKWSQVVTQLREPLAFINNAYGTLVELGNEAQKADFRFADRKEDIDKWAADVRDSLKGIPAQLRTIDDVIRGNLKEFSDEPLMRVFNDKVRSSTQSAYYGAIIYFERWLLIQQKALICLGNAYMYQNPDKKVPAEFNREDFTDLESLLLKLSQGWNSDDPLATYICQYLPSKSAKDIVDDLLLRAWAKGTDEERAGWLNQRMIDSLAAGFNQLVKEPALYDAQRFARAQLSEETKALLEKNPTGKDLIRLNRRLLAEAYPNGISKGRVTPAELLTFLERWTKVADAAGQKVSRFQAQADVSKPYVNQLDQFYGNLTWGDNEGRDFVTFSRDIKGVDTNPVVTQTGKVVVGLQLYWKGNGIGLKILQSPFAQGKVRQNVAQASAQDRPNWREGAPPNENFFVVHLPDGTRQINNVVDMKEVKVPDGEVVTGAQLYLKERSNALPRIAVKVQSASTNAEGNLDETTRTWHENSELGHNDPADIVSLTWKFRGINIHAVEPNPLEPISGVKLFLHQGSGSNRIAVAVRTGMFNTGELWKKANILNIEDAWRKYDVVDMALRPAVSDRQPQAIGAATQ